MGFNEVYDYVEGKIDWIGRGLPMEGKGPHYAVVGEVADRDAVMACRFGDQVGGASKELDSGSHDYCVVLNEHDIVLGRLRKKDLRGSPEETVERVMEPGPTTVRPKEPAKALLERMKKRGVPSLIVTTKKGRLLGVATQRDLERLLSSD